MKTKSNYQILMILGMLLLASGIYLSILRVATEIYLTLTNAGIIILVIAVIKYNKLGTGISRDERTKQLGSRALSYSWLFTFVIANILFWLNYAKIISIDANQAISLILYPMLLSASIFQLWMKRKGVINEK